MSLPLSTGLILIELTLLYVSSTKLIQLIYQFLFLLFRNRVITMTILTILLFPGTVIHELAHLFVAEVLRVPTGKLTLVPEGLDGGKTGGEEDGEHEVRTGSVAIAQTDPLRRTLIGLAPVYVGILALTVVSYFLPIVWQNVLVDIQNETLFSRISLYSLFFILYALFAISNSMFSSSEDMKGVVPFTITVALFAAAAYFAGLRIGLTGELLTKLSLVIQALVRSLGIVLAVNLVVAAGTSLLLTLLSPRHKK